MATSFVCPTCRHPFSVKSIAGRRTVECPECGDAIPTDTKPDTDADDAIPVVAAKPKKRIRAPEDDDDFEPDKPSSYWKAVFWGLGAGTVTLVFMLAIGSLLPARKPAPAPVAFAIQPAPVNNAVKFPDGVKLPGAANVPAPDNADPAGKPVPKPKTIIVPKDWVRFDEPKGRFSAAFPMEPEADRNEPDEDIAEWSLWSAQKGDEMFVVELIVMTDPTIITPQTEKTANIFVENYRKGAAERLGKPINSALPPIKAPNRLFWLMTFIDNDARRTSMVYLEVYKGFIITRTHSMPLASRDQTNRKAFFTGFKAD